LAAPLVQVLVAHESANQRVSEYLYGVARVGEYDGAWRYYLADHLGSVRLLVGVDGSIEGTRTYRPYGLPLDVDGTVNSIYGFTGEQTDPTGLIYLRTRMYAPSLGQFMSRDLWRGDVNHPMTLHKFLYSLDDPLNHSDPSGLFPIPPVRPPHPIPCVTDCHMFVVEVRSLIEGLRSERKCSRFVRLLTKEEDLVLDLLAWYYSGIPFTWHGLYLPSVPQESQFTQGVPDHWTVPAWDQQETPEFSWDHPINQRESDLGQTMRQSYGFKRPYFEQTHHYFAFLKLAYHLGGPAVEWRHKQLEIDRQLRPALDHVPELEQRGESPSTINKWYAWIYRESVYDLFIVDEAINLARAVDLIGVDVIPTFLQSWCANNEADVWSFEDEVDQFYFDFPEEYWPDEQYWPRR
jgi:RHS repeat-associated protein